MPVDRGAIDGQLREIGEGERWWEQREFRDLPYILHPEERIRGIATGKLLGPRRPRLLPTAQWLLVATSQRVICLKQERFGRKQVDVQMGQIVGMQHTSRIRNAQITLETPQRKYRIRMEKADVFRFLGALAPLVTPLEGQTQNAGQPAASWLPGIAAAALPRLPRLVSRVATTPAPDAVTRAELARVESSIERLENEVDRLQQQVEFLEKLLQQRSGDTLSLSGPSADS
jgi:hypothetical protein